MKDTGRAFLTRGSDSPSSSSRFGKEELNDRRRREGEGEDSRLASKREDEDEDAWEERGRWRRREAEGGGMVLSGVNGRDSQLRGKGEGGELNEKDG